ncbi:OLC1v1035588C1 [Oldenlandia corymbosa var. corymbosa]|uniref:OLC1v1035588C1 n=1 Tax=Oldenlandia corymbosa var. corymbosa TaxID=529605 RepID=A0AAV1CWP9_OLDCO|nr:OLC1v1035588C1 [Oldenlandia corymbosa var. corymbosa]
MISQRRNFQILIRYPDLPGTTKFVTLENLPNPDFTLQDLVVSACPDSRSILSSLSFNFNGKLLRGSSKLSDCRVAPFSTLTLNCRLFGGGGDGGATGAESRDCYLNMYATKKPDKVDPNEMRLSKWLNCSLSNEPLKRPVVIDMLGNLFNKEALVEALLKKNLPKEFGYIKGLKDMVSVELSMIPGLENKRDSGSPSGPKFQCPISGLEFNGKYKFFALRPCGHVLSAKALKEVKSSVCLVCHKEFNDSDKIVINGSDEEVAKLRERMEEERAKIKDKKVKKVKNGGLAVNGEDDGTVEVPRLSGTKHGIDTKVDGKAVLKVEGNGKAMVNGKMEMKKPAKKFKAVDVAPANATKEVYASIFTSSKKSNFKETYSCRSLPLGRN